MTAGRLLSVCTLAVGALIVLTGLAGAAPTTAGDLDPGFGLGGRVVLTPGITSGGSAAALQPDGKIVLAGTVNNGPPPPPVPPRGLATESYSDFLAVRLAANGALDGSFGTGGFAQIPIDLGYNNTDVANAVASGPNGTLVLGGYAYNAGGSFDSVIVRLTSAGSPDPSFAGDGIQTVDVSLVDTVYGVAVQQDGKVVAAGGGGSGFTVFRLDTNGSLDLTFGTGGIVNTVIGDPTSRDEARAVVISGDGKIVVAGAADAYPSYGPEDVAVVRYLPTGQPDSTFGTDGVVVTPGPPGEAAFPYALALQPDGKIVVGGAVGCAGCAPRAMLVRYLTTGALDGSFGNGGTVITSFGDSGLALSVAVDADGKLIAGGYASTGGNADFALARYNADGSLDASFGSGGKGTYDLGLGELDIGHALLIDGGARRVVMAGGTSVDGHGHVAAIGVELGPLGTGPPPPPPAVRCRVPRVVHLRLAKARTKIRRAHCRVGRIRSVRSRRFRGIVVKQSPRAGRRLTRGARVNLVVGRR